MDSDQERLNRHVRETISALSDEELRSIASPGSAANYTPFAILVAQQELKRRLRMKTEIIVRRQVRSA